jgi:hypothetical protein
MRLPILFGSIALFAAAAFATEAHAQGIRIGKLKQMTAPYVGAGVELMAIGYEGDTTDSDEKPALFGFSGRLDPAQLAIEVEFAFIETVKPNGDCLTCELRDDRDAILREEQFAFLLQN